MCVCADYAHGTNLSNPIYNQTTEQTILGNTVGSSRYMAFLSSLGTSVRLHDCNPDLIYLGGLDINGADGEMAILWHEEITQSESKTLQLSMILQFITSIIACSCFPCGHLDAKLHQ